ncbi:MAG: hypothetical protein DRI90_23010 [Deltaproteobacteria bacterium]|nr:MAG: hypothetical protein DRI90_23010 [Deltaproteobacteria bacterium]
MIRSKTAASALLWLLAMASLTLSAPASAQPGDTALAEALFDEGRQLMDAGKVGAACPKLAESYRLDPAGGTLLNLAVCHEKEGKLATAWSEFKDALGMARSARKPEREKLASEHIDALEPRLNRLTIQLAPGAAVPGLQITHNGSSLGGAAMGTALPVDGGEHEIVVSATGHRSWKASLQMGREGETRTVVVPVLEEVSDGAASSGPAGASLAPTGQSAPSGDGSTQRTLGYIVGGAGIAGTIVGAIFGVRAISLASESDDKCGDGELCPDTDLGREGLAAHEDAHTSATLSNAFIGAGLGLIGVGLVVVLTAPAGEQSEPATSALVSPTLGPAGVGLTLRATW